MGLIGKLRAWCGARGTLAVLGVGFAAGLVVFAGVGAGVRWTNTEQFCIGCHEMRDNVYAEFKGTIHDVNRSGVRAVCADCHVPKEPVDMMIRKARATFELVGHFTGVIDTKEKFEAHRTELAHRVWRRMKATDSRECRNCHTETAMGGDNGSEKARARHEKAKAQGKTCIDCHYGIAHKEPEGDGPEDLKL